MSYLVNFPIFPLLLLLWLGIMAVFVYYYLRSQGWNPGPLTAKGEIEEFLAKEAVLKEMGTKPNEKNRKYKWFGLFSYIEDEIEYTGEEDFED